MNGENLCLRAVPAIFDNRTNDKGKNLGQKTGRGSSSILLLNKHRRSIKCPGLFGARFSAGTIRREPSGVGDSILINLRKGFLAIADSSDRNPCYARAFMEYFSEFLAGFPSLEFNRVQSSESFEDLQKSIISKSKTLLKNFYCYGSCAFTGLILIRTIRGMKAIVLHSGDTLLYVGYPGSKIRQITQTNFWLIGKTGDFFQAEIIEVAPLTRFLFMTDGFQCFAPAFGENPLARIEELIHKHPIEGVPDEIFDYCDIGQSGKDDFAIMTFNPNGIVPNLPQILIGGTNAFEETDRRSWKGQMSDIYELPKDQDMELFL